MCKDRSEAGAVKISGNGAELSLKKYFSVDMSRKDLQLFGYIIGQHLKCFRLMQI